VDEEEAFEVIDGFGRLSLTRRPAEANTRYWYLNFPLGLITKWGINRGVPPLSVPNWPAWSAVTPRQVDNGILLTFVLLRLFATYLAPIRPILATSHILTHHVQDNLVQAGTPR
jgi:hypothetical protein